MSLTKLLLACLFCAAFAFAGTAQSERVMNKAAEKTEQLNQKLISVDAKHALTDEQREKITALNAKKTQQMRKIKKSDASAEEQAEQKKTARKAINKEMNAVLTKEQRMAKKAAKNKD